MSTRTNQFLFTLQHARGGDMQFELSEALLECIERTMQTGKKSTLKIELNITRKGRHYYIADSHKTSLPLEDRAPTVMFVDDNGDLCRKDPRQREMELEEVDFEQARGSAAAE